MAAALLREDAALASRPRTASWESVMKGAGWVVRGTAPHERGPGRGSGAEWAGSASLDLGVEEGAGAQSP